MRKISTIKDHYGETRLFQSRILFALLVVAGMLAMLAYRYTNLQIIHYETYRTQSDKNRVYVQPLPPKRGLIVDRYGTLLANNEPIAKISPDPDIANDATTKDSNLHWFCRH